MMSLVNGVERPLNWSDYEWPRLSVHGALDRARGLWGPKKVLYSYPDAGTELSIDDVQRHADAWTAALLTAGVAVGDRVAVALAGDPLWPILQVAISQAGAVLVGINIRYGTHELMHVLRRAQPRVIITTGNTPGRDFGDRLAAVLDELRAETAAEPLVVLSDGDAPGPWRLAEGFLEDGREASHEVEPRRAEVDPDQVALIQYTSGSTAAPKGVMLSHDALLRSAFHVMRAAGYEANDVVYSALPFYHIGGSITTGPGAVACGARMVVPALYDAARSVRQMIELRCSAEQGHAAMFTMQIDAARREGLLDQLALRKGWVAAPPSIMRRIAYELGIQYVVPVYGMSEYGLISAGSLNESLEERLGGIGWPTPGTEVRLHPQATSDGIGEIQVRGSQLMMGYYGDPEATRAALGQDGWLRTGDLARCDEDGRLVFAGREKDMIKPGGENVSAAEIEEFLRGHPHIAAVAVIAVPDSRLGQAPAAVIQPISGATLDLDAVREFCTGRIARFKIPRAVFLEAALPLLANGKIDKLSLVSRYGQCELG